SVNELTDNASQLEFIKQPNKDSFNPISKPFSMQPKEIGNNSLSIEKIIDISNPTFIGNNLFIEDQGKTLDTVTQQLGLGKVDYDPASLVARILNEVKE
ncbi:12832_t:CDS:1, partial [Dentiscutata heterogama]